MSVIQINIKNVSDSKIKSVNLFNFETEKNIDLRYSCGSVDYKELLHLIKDEFGKEIEGIKIVCSSYNEKYIKEFFSESRCFYIKKDCFGSSYSYPLDMTPEAQQFQNSMVNIRFNKELNKPMLKSGFNLNFDYIPADTTVVVIIVLKNDKESNKLTN